jgi:hypothetical protein
MLIRLARGLNFLGMLNQVFLPMITTFFRPEGARVVTHLKKFMSSFSRHGSRPAWPIPFDFVAHTIRLSGIILPSAGLLLGLILAEIIFLAEFGQASTFSLRRAVASRTG